MEKERALNNQSPSEKLDKRLDKMVNVLTPIVAALSGFAAGINAGLERDFLALGFAISSALLTTSAIFKHIGIRKEADNLRAQIESQKTPTEDDYSQFG